MLAGTRWRRAFSTNNMRQKATGQLAIIGKEGIRLNHFHSHAMVVRFPLLSFILSLYTATVLFREASSPVELVLKNKKPWSNTMPVVVFLCPKDSKIMVAFSPASVVMAIVPF
jgi:hypothetical protein